MPARRGSGVAGSDQAFAQEQDARSPGHGSGRSGSRGTTSSSGGSRSRWLLSRRGTSFRDCGVAPE
jgi:hypothetical protein